MLKRRLGACFYVGPPPFYPSKSVVKPPRFDHQKSSWSKARFPFVSSPFYTQHATTVPLTILNSLAMAMAPLDVCIVGKPSVPQEIHRRTQTLLFPHI
jgi:hypothetical protein